MAIPDGGVVAFNAGIKADGGVVETGDELEDGDLADTDRVALGGLSTTGLDVHVKTSDDDGDPWYVRRDGRTGDVSAHRRGSTPSTLIDERTDDTDDDDVDELEDT